MKRNMFCIFLALILLVIVFSATPELSPLPAAPTENAELSKNETPDIISADASSPSAEAPEPTESSGAAQAAKPEITASQISALPHRQPGNTDLSDRFLMITDYKNLNWLETVALWDGRAVARGLLREVLNLATGETVGFSKRTFTVKPQAEDELEYYDYIECPQRSDLYHLDGSFWCSCENLNVYGVLGNYFFGYDLSSGYDYDKLYTTEPSDPSTFRAAPILRLAGNGHCLIENDGGSDFLGITGYALVDDSLNIVARMDRHGSSDQLSVFEGTPGNYHYYLYSSGLGHLVDMATFETMPYVEVKGLGNGCLVFKKDDGKYDLMDWEGNLLLTDRDHEICGYNGIVTVEREWKPPIADRPMWEPSITRVYLGDRLWKQFDTGSPEQYDVELIGERLFVTDHDLKQITCYDAQLEESATIDGEYVSTYYSNAVTSEKGSEYWLIPEGRICAIPVRNQDHVRCLASTELESAALEDICYSNTANWESYDLLNASGEIVQSGYDYLYSTYYPGIFAAMRGARWGIIDKDGNWLWSEYIYDE